MPLLTRLELRGNEGTLLNLPLPPAKFSVLALVANKLTLFPFQLKRSVNENFTSRDQD